MSGTLPVIGLHGAPRSGTTWIGQMVNAAPQAAFRYQPFFAYAFRPRIDAARTPEALDEVLADIAVTEDDFVLQRGAGRLARQELSFAKFEATRLVYKEVRYHHLLPQLMRIPRFKGVGIVRNPLDVLASWRAAPREFEPSWDFADEWRAAPRKNAGRVEEFYGYEGWKRAATIFRAMAAEHPDRFRILAYEDVVRDPPGQMGELFDFMGLPFGDEVAAFVARSTSSDDQDPYGVFRDGRARADAAPIPAEIRQAILEDLRASGFVAYACGDAA